MNKKYSEKGFQISIKFNISKNYIKPFSRISRDTFVIQLFCFSLWFCTYDAFALMLNKIDKLERGER